MSVEAEHGLIARIKRQCNTVLTVECNRVRKIIAIEIRAYFAQRTHKAVLQYVHIVVVKIDFAQSIFEKNLHRLGIGYLVDTLAAEAYRHLSFGFRMAAVMHIAQTLFYRQIQNGLARNLRCIHILNQKRKLTQQRRVLYRIELIKSYRNTLIFTIIIIWLTTRIGEMSALFEPPDEVDRRIIFFAVSCPLHFYLAEHFGLWREVYRIKI